MIEPAHDQSLEPATVDLQIFRGVDAGILYFAKRLGAPKAVRAVARACATNRIAVAIPCHRVIGSDGSLTGYRGGIERKRALLAKESGGKFKLRP